MTARVGVDTGGTFTDVVTAAGEVVKLPSRPADPAGAVGEGVAPGWAAPRPWPTERRWPPTPCWNGAAAGWR